MKQGDNSSKIAHPKLSILQKAQFGCLFKGINSKRQGTRIFLFSLLISFSLFLVSTAQAASLYFSPSSGSFSPNQTFSVKLFVSSPDQAMNAVSCQISFPAEKLEVKSISKTDSIINFWVQEPTFSNTTGTITLEGVVLNPGFIGSNGKIITINFKTKTIGDAPLVFSSGAVLANDGRGTNILSTMSSAFYTIKGETNIQAPEGVVSKNAPKAPIISSPTHPDPNKWYSNNNPKFIWQVPSDVNGIKLQVDHLPNSVPTKFYSEPISEKELRNLEDGVWYFHLQFRNKAGWGEVSHFKFQIDTRPPKPFKIEVKEEKEISKIQTPSAFKIEEGGITNPQPVLSYKTTDGVSGIDYYEIIIDKESPIKTEEPEYKIPPQDLGKHTIIVKAIDKAQNETLSMTEINILPIESPVITDYPHELLPGSTLSIKGSALPDVTIKVYIQKDKEEPKTGETKSDKEGKWTYIEVMPLERGTYQIWAEAIDINGAKSKPSEKVIVLVSPPVFVRIGKLVIDYLTTIITLLVLILVIIFGIIWGRQKIKERREKLKKEVTEAEKILYQAFKTLKKEVEKQVEKLDGEIGLSEREKEIRDYLKEILKNSEKLISKKIKDIEKEL